MNLKELLKPFTFLDIHNVKLTLDYTCYKKLSEKRKKKRVNVNYNNFLKTFFCSMVCFYYYGKCFFLILKERNRINSCVAVAVSQQQE